MQDLLHSRKGNAVSLRGHRVYSQAFVDLNNCVQHFQSLNLTTNASKSNFLNFSLRSGDSGCGPAIMLADSDLEETESTKFLGIHLD
ncbi:hypothetical protein J6590_001084 [Homalodisca vitripennis]|nr:hypothetical protein J6590_001084 [Homalodisca vitripennis]